MSWLLGKKQEIDELSGDASVEDDSLVKVILWETKLGILSILPWEKIIRASDADSWVSSAHLIIAEFCLISK